MDELRMVRREDGALILANELGEEYRFAIDDVVASEIRQLSKRPVGATSVRPREIQSLLRAGKSRAQVAEELDLEEADVERFEEPVRAEQRYMLELARLITVRTDPSRSAGDEAEEQRFGEVISERLIGLGNTESTWRSWRDEITGWLIGLSFDSRDGDHDAIWSLDHRKRVLTPLSPDATNLSKIGEIGDRLIPKLRAVESEQGERFDSGAFGSGAFNTGAFDPDALLAETGEHDLSSGVKPAEDGALFGVGTLTTDERQSGTATPPLTDAEYERRREIDFHAVSTPADDSGDLSQTADLLDALRRRRGERAQAVEADSDAVSGSESIQNPFDGATEDDSDPEVSEDTEQVQKPEASKRSGAARNIWGASGVSGSNNGAPSKLRAVDPVSATDDGAKSAPTSTSTSTSAKPTPPEAKSSKRGRSSIPSWDDILFGTRSDDDPA